MKFKYGYKLKYEIAINSRDDQQVKLFLKCIIEKQAEGIVDIIKRRNFQVSKILSSYDGNYTHLVYVYSTENELSKIMPEIQAFSIDNLEKFREEKRKTLAQAAQKFKTWNRNFDAALKKLESEISNLDRNNRSDPRFFSADIDQKINDGLITETEIEDQLLTHAANDSSSLRKLIALYARYERYEKIVDLCKSRRSDVLALPISGRLAEQIVRGYLQTFELSQDKDYDLLHAAQTITREFLPELERIRQADGVRELLGKLLNHQRIQQSDTQKILREKLGQSIEIKAKTDASNPLKEELCQLIEIEPNERIKRLETLQQKYPRADDISLALAEAYAAVDKSDRALDLYESLDLHLKDPVKKEEMYRRWAELLLDRKNFTEVLNLIPNSEKMSPALSGLRGAALYHTEKQSQALPLLEKAWQNKEHGFQILIPLARLWSGVREKQESAAQVYEILLETAFKKIPKDEDYPLIQNLSYQGYFGEISGEQLWKFYELKQK